MRKICKRVSPSPAAGAERSSEESEELKETGAEPPAVIPSPEPSVVGQQAESQGGTPAAAPLTEEELTQQVSELVRVNSRVSGKAPLDPAELKRHERLEKIRSLVDDAQKKSPADGRSPPLAPARRAEGGAQADLA